MAEPDEACLGGRMVAVPTRVAAPMLPPLPKRPPRPVPDFNEFDNTMASLINEIRTPRTDDGQARR